MGVVCVARLLYACVYICRSGADLGLVYVWNSTSEPEMAMATAARPPDP